MAEKKTKAKSKTKTKAKAESKEAKTPRARKAKAPKKAEVRHASAADAFRGKSADELADQLAKLKKEQFNLRFQKANGQLEKTSRVRTVRRDIARISTVLNEQRRKAAQV